MGIRKLVSTCESLFRCVFSSFWYLQHFRVYKRLVIEQIKKSDDHLVLLGSAMTSKRFMGDVERQEVKYFRNKYVYVARNNLLAVIAYTKRHGRCLIMILGYLSVLTVDLFWGFPWKYIHCLSGMYILLSIFQLTVRLPTGSLHIFALHKHIQVTGFIFVILLILR